MRYAGKLRDSLTWWLGSKREFVINDEYKLELLFIDKQNNSAKIRVTNLKATGNDSVSDAEILSGDEDDVNL
jgi:hypothetical protein